MRIAVDAMGGDYAPKETVKGAVEAAAFPEVSKLLLVGDKARVEQELAQCRSVSDKIEVRHASETIEMAESPALAVRRKKDASISRAVLLARQGDADAVVSAGNTGAAVVAATMRWRTLEGILRPAIAVLVPSERDPFVLIDAGANVDCDATMLYQFAVMGSVYARVILKRPNPVVGLLNIGGEDSKGSGVIKEAHARLQASTMNFRGNVEGKDIFGGGTDVVVCDGFLGNVVLKTTESTARAVGHWMRQECTRTPWRILGTLLLKGALKGLKRKVDPEMYGGAPLLGVRGTCIISHGSSSSRAIYHAVRVAAASVGHRLNELIVEEIKKGEGA
jgi:glycerol-3-phosphate acyltransferase PlsX